MVGGLGRAVQFRTERFRAQDKWQRFRPSLVSQGHAFPIHDLSMNGVSFIAVNGAPIPPVSTIVEFGIRLGEVAAYSGEGEICRLEPHPKGQKVALRLTRDFIDIQGLERAHDDLVLEEELSFLPMQDANLIPSEYRQVCSDIVHLIRRYKDVLDRAEKRFRQEGNLGLESLERLADRCEASFRAEWNELRVKANHLLFPVVADRKIMSAVKRYTMTTVAPEFMVSPGWKRANNKPLGYPGDYVVMNYLYAQDHRGDTVFARMLHKIGVEVPVGACVPPRMRMLVDAIREATGREPADGMEVRVASLGCGPAREVEEYLTENRPPRPVRFTLIDQDDRALSYAYKRVFPKARQYPDLASATCYYASFGQILKDDQLLKEFPGQDLIYTAGIFDYIRLGAAQALLKRLYDRLAPGGCLIVGNMKAPSDGFWELEFIMDWTILYRTRDEVLQMAELVTDAEIELLEDPTGYTYLMYVRKPA